MKRLATALVVALISTSLFACGDADNTTSTKDTSNFPLQDDVPGDSHVRYVADPDGDLAYRITEASASAGKATIQLVNSQSIAHNVAIEAPNGETIGETEPISEGINSTTVVLKPGVYVVYCSVPGHRKAGMLGHLTVNPK